MDGQLLDRHDEKILRWRVPDPAETPAGFLPILRAKTRHQMMQLSKPCTEGREQLRSQTLPVRESRLADVRIEGRTIRQINPWKSCRRRHVAAHPPSDDVRVKLRDKDEVGDHITHLPKVTGAGCAPRLWRQGLQGLREPLRLRLDDL